MFAWASLRSAHPTLAGAIHSYINERNPVAAARFTARVRAAAKQLGEHPRIGHAGTAPGTLEWVVEGLPYIIVYELADSEDEVVVLGIYHGAVAPRAGSVELGHVNAAK